MGAELRLIREYIKNLSFESPRATEFMDFGEKPRLAVDVDVGVTPQSSDLHEVTLSLEVHAKNEIGPSTILS